MSIPFRLFQFLIFNFFQFRFRFHFEYLFLFLFLFIGSFFPFIPFDTSFFFCLLCWLVGFLVGKQYFFFFFHFRPTSLIKKIFFFLNVWFGWKLQQWALWIFGNIYVWEKRSARINNRLRMRMKNKRKEEEKWKRQKIKKKETTRETVIRNEWEQRTTLPSRWRSIHSVFFILYIHLSFSFKWFYKTSFFLSIIFYLYLFISLFPINIHVNGH